jgi:hypothetical protein
MAARRNGSGRRIASVGVFVQHVIYLLGMRFAFSTGVPLFVVHGIVKVDRRKQPRQQQAHTPIVASSQGSQDGTRCMDRITGRA